MNEQQFWEIIGLFDWSRSGNDQEVMEPAINYLAQLGVEELNEFDEILASILFSLDSEKYAKHTGFGREHYSVDLFLYNRCCVVANGKAFYDRVLADPTALPGDLEFESLLYLTKDAANRKGIDDYWHDTNVSYETFSNREGWKDAHFPPDLPPGHRPKS